MSRPDARRSRGRNNPQKANLARILAWEVLVAVDEDDAYANLLLPRKIARTRLRADDAALATELTYGTLRARGLYDAIIAEAASRKVDTLEIPVLNVMRMGAHQLLAMRIPDHAAVGETVAVIKQSLPRASGIVNAVLRRIGERSYDDWLALVTAGLPEDQAKSLRYSHPAWIVSALREALEAHGRSPAEIDLLLQSHNDPAPVVLTALPGLDRSELPGTPTGLSPLGVILDRGDPGNLEAVRTGRARVQDEGSQLTALTLLEAEAPEGEWLDMCAGPGGKTAILAATAAQRGAPVTALDASGHRADLVVDSTRAFADTVEVFKGDGREFAEAYPGDFTRVLVDVPCSGLGALRRRPEARWRRSPEDVRTLRPLQDGLLRAAWQACAPGGVVAYSTCSPHKHETLDVVRAFAADTPAVQILNTPDHLARVTGQPAESFASSAVGNGAAAQLWSHVHETDGMFICLIRRPA